MKTVKQVAADLGVSRQAVYKKLSTIPSTAMSTNDKGVTVLDADAEALLRDELSTKQTTKLPRDSQVDSQVDCLISMLQKELEIKNRQIEALTVALEQTSASLHAAQALHVGTMQKQLTDDKEPVEKSAGIFYRILTALKGK